MLGSAHAVNGTLGSSNATVGKLAEHAVVDGIWLVATLKDTLVIMSVVYRHEAQKNRIWVNSTHLQPVPWGIHPA